MAPKTAASATAPHDPSPKKMTGLPVLVATPVDLGRLIRELDSVDEQLHQAALRNAGAADAPRISRLLELTVELNKITLTDAAERKLLSQFLESVRAKAPVLHMSFSADPPAAFVEKLMAWLRREIHPLVLVTVGLQPNLGAGCVIRTTNKYFDLSLRQDFSRKRDLLLAAMSEKMAAKPAADTPKQPWAETTSGEVMG